MAAGFDRAPVAGVEGFDRVRAAQHSSDLYVVVEERDELGPGVVPQPDDGRVALPPFLGQFVEGRAGGGGVDRGVDRFEAAFELVPVLAGGEPERVADQMKLMPTSA